MSKLVVTNLAQLHEWDRKRIEFACEGGNRILASDLLRQEIMAAKLTETRINGVGPALTNLEVYERIMNADQLHPLDKLGVLDVQVILYRKSWSRVVGYTFVDSLTISMNRKYFGGPLNTFSNLFHESTHQLGFLHQANWSSTVPYRANQWVEKLWPILCKDVDAAYKKWWES